MAPHCSHYYIAAVSYLTNLLTGILMLCFAVLEVYQFARDASVAEAWLMAHEPYLSSQEYGVCFYMSILQACLICFRHIVWSIQLLKQIIAVIVLSGTDAKFILSCLCPLAF